MERGGDGVHGKCPDRGGLALIGPPEEAGLLEHLGEFLDEQRHAVGPGGKLFDDLIRHVREAAPAPNQLGDLAAGEPIDGDLTAVCTRRPGGNELGAGRQDRHDPVVGPLVEQEREELQGRGIDPVHVLDDEQDGPPVRLLTEPVDQRLQRLLLLALGRERQIGEAAVGGDRHQRGEQGEVLGVIEPEDFQMGGQLIEPGRWRVIVPEPEDATEALGRGREAAILMVGRATPLDDRGGPAGRLVGDELLDRQD